MGKTPTVLQNEIHQRYVPNYYPRMTVQVAPEGWTEGVQRALASLAVPGTEKLQVVSDRRPASIQHAFTKGEADG